MEIGNRLISARPFGFSTISHHAGVKGAGGTVSQNGERKITGADVASSFSEILRNAIHDVNRMDVSSSRMLEKIVSGESENLHDAVLALEESRLALQYLTEVRNKIIESYKEIMRMQL